MSILSKFKSFLFEEEEMEDEIIVEDELEPVVLSKPVVESKPKAEEVLPPVVEKTVEEKRPEVKEGTHFGSITVDTPQKRTVSTTRKTLERSEKLEFTFSDVISPMFGTGKVEPGKKADYSTTHTKKQNPLGTVISPMYGASELQEMEEHAQTVLTEKEEAPVEVMKEDHDLVDIPLEQMLVKDEPVSNDDVLQFSLFGEEEIVKHAVHQNDLMDDDLGKKA